MNIVCGFTGQVEIMMEFEHWIIAAFTAIAQNMLSSVWVKFSIGCHLSCHYSSPCGNLLRKILLDCLYSVLFIIFIG
jgi:hypothetical protein